LPRFAGKEVTDMRTNLDWNMINDHLDVDMSRFYEDDFYDPYDDDCADEYDLGDDLPIAKPAPSKKKVSANSRS